MGSVPAGMTDAEFIHAQLNEDQRLANACWARAKAWAADGWDIVTASPTDYRPLAWGVDSDTSFAEHASRHDPTRVVRQVGAIHDALVELERIVERCPHPDAQMWARAAIGRLTLIWADIDNADEEVPGAVA